MRRRDRADAPGLDDGKRLTDTGFMEDLWQSSFTGSHLPVSGYPNQSSTQAQIPAKHSTKTA